MKKSDFWLSFVRRPGWLLGPTLVDVAEILRGWWGMLGLCLVKVLARLVEVRLSYRPKTGEKTRYFSLKIQISRHNHILLTESKLFFGLQICNLMCSTTFVYVKQPNSQAKALCPYDHAFWSTVPLLLSCRLIRSSRCCRRLREQRRSRPADSYEGSPVCRSGPYS